ncbi:MAG: PqiC family protein [Thermodesulfobacteriota bacterium]|nr:PqiC family protein [Thermodesulfobacteriota bacterium]
MKLNIVLKKSTVLLFCCLLAGVAGCGSRSKPATFYLLTSLPGAESIGVQAGTPMILSVGPVRLPSYLGRKQLLLRSGKNELIIKEYSRWGEPLQENFQRVLIENLSVLLATPQVYDYNNHETKEPDFQLLIDVSRFDVTDDGLATLTAFWTINDSQGNQLLRNKSTLSTKSQSLESGAIVNTLNQMVIDFSTELTRAIRSLQ